jgi:hypothetical protein
MKWVNREILLGYTWLVFKETCLVMGIFDHLSTKQLISIIGSYGHFNEGEFIWEVLA